MCFDMRAATNDYFYYQLIRPLPDESFIIYNLTEIYEKCNAMSVSNIHFTVTYVKKSKANPHID